MLFFWSSFEFGFEKIATEDFRAKFTPSCNRIANASGQAVYASPHAIFHSLNAEYVEMVKFKVVVSSVRAQMQTPTDYGPPRY